MVFLSGALLLATFLSTAFLLGENGLLNLPALGFCFLFIPSLYLALALGCGT
jgi:hypothetical protein